MININSLKRLFNSISRSKRGIVYNEDYNYSYSWGKNTTMKCSFSRGNMVFPSICSVSNLKNRSKSSGKFRH